MQEELDQRTVSIIVSGSKFTGRLFKAAVTKLWRYGQKKLDDHQHVTPRGKQSVKKLIGQNQGVTEAELGDDRNVKAFNRIARKYGVDYAIKKIPGDPPKHILFFKARDQGAINTAFQEYMMCFRKKDRQKSSLHQEMEELSAAPTIFQPQKEKEISR